MMKEFNEIISDDLVDKRAVLSWFESNELKLNKFKEDIEKLDFFDGDSLLEISDLNSLQVRTERLGIKIHLDVLKKIFNAIVTLKRQTYRKKGLNSLTSCESILNWFEAVTTLNREDEDFQRFEKLKIQNSKDFNALNLVELGFPNGVIGSILQWKEKSPSLISKGEEFIKFLTELFGSLRSFDLRTNRMHTHPISERFQPHNWKMIRRKKNFEEFYDYVSKRTNEILEARIRNENTQDKKFNAGFGISASPGMGKSSWGEDVCSGIHLDEYCNDQVCKEFLKNAISLPITFNNHTTATFDTINARFGLALRAAYSYFIDSSAINWVTFASKIINSEKKFQLLTVIEAILLDNKPIVMMVDEIIRCGDFHERKLVMEDIGACLNQFQEKFWVIVSTLQWTPNKNQSIEKELYSFSDRIYVNTIFENISSEEMFSENFSGLDLDNREKMIVQFALEGVGVTPRQCTKIYSWVSTNKGRLNDPSDIFKIRDLFHEKTLSDLTLDHIKFAFSKEKANLDERTGDDASDTVLDSISKGIFVASMSMKEKVTAVKMQPFLIYDWILNNPLLCNDRGNIYNHLKDSLESCFSIDGKKWEKVWAHLQIVWRIMFPDVIPSYFNHIYSLRETMFKPTSIVHSFTLDSSFHIPKDLKKGKDQDLDVCIFGGPSNEGCDVILSFKTSEGQRITLIEEMKFSHLESQNPEDLTFKMIREKSNHVKEGLKSQKAIEMKNCHFVFVVFRTLTSGVLLLQRILSIRKFKAKPRWDKAVLQLKEMNIEIPRNFRQESWQKIYDLYCDLTKRFESVSILDFDIIQSFLPPPFKQIYGLSNQMVIERLAFNSTHLMMGAIGVDVPTEDSPTIS